MLILGFPYVSDLLASWAEQTQHPVLNNEMAQLLQSQGYSLNLISEEETSKHLDAGEPVYSNSENALDWVVAHSRNETLNNAITSFKNKAKMREILAPLNPNYFFKTCPADELASLNFSDLPCPFILKPAVGFVSLGVYVINNETEWRHALSQIASQADVWNKRYPESVVDTNLFLLEGYITGIEYAIDAYFDQDGTAHVLNIMRHDFVDADDTSDRLYSTNAHVFSETFDEFEAWLTRVNAFVGARNFPVHVEVRRNEQGIYPIEFNPLRFAGFCSTDIAYYAYGIRTYEYFLENKVLNWEQAVANTPFTTSMSMLALPEDVDPSLPFNYDAFCSHFSDICRMQVLDSDRYGTYGFLFFKTTEETKNERTFALTCDLRAYLP